jgi:ABC-type multidrug transport system fused ATPase/permease subunit
MKTQDLWVEGYPTSTNPLRFLWFTTRPHRPAAITTTVIVAFAAMLSASVTYLFKLIVNAATSLSNTHDYHALYLAAAWWIMVQLIGEWLWRLAAWFAASWADGVRATARDSLISYVTLHSSSYFSDHFAGSTIRFHMQAVVLER